MFIGSLPPYSGRIYLLWCKGNCDILDLYAMFDEGGGVSVYAGRYPPDQFSSLCTKGCFCYGRSGSRPTHCLLKGKDLPNKIFIKVRAYRPSKNVVMKVKVRNLDILYLRG